MHSEKFIWRCCIKVKYQAKHNNTCWSHDRPCLAFLRHRCVVADLQQSPTVTVLPDDVIAAFKLLRYGRSCIVMHRSLNELSVLGLPVGLIQTAESRAIDNALMLKFQLSSFLIQVLRLIP